MDYVTRISATPSVSGIVSGEGVLPAGPRGLMAPLAYAAFIVTGSVVLARLR